MLIDVFILLIIVKISLSTTSIKTYPTVNLTENVPINTNVIKLIKDNENIEMRKMKLILLNLSGFETNLFEIKNENIYTINLIDREQFLGEKRCFNRLYCLIELHILVNDGQEYWVIPIHIIDENDNKPEFKNDSIELKFYENNFNGYKIPFEGAIDIDEGINNEINYILDCSIKKKDLNFIKKEKEKLINCFPLFELIIFSQSSLINQYDQLGLKFNPSSSSSSSFLNSYQFILYGFNLNQNKEKQLINSMIINVKIEKILTNPKFLLSEYKFVIKENSLLKKGNIIGQVYAKSNDLSKKIIYQIINQTNSFIQINSLTGQLFIFNENINLNEINLLIEASYFNNENLKSFINVQIFIRLLNKLNNHFLINYQIKSLFIQQLNNSNQFLIQQKFYSNQILFNLAILAIYYPSDQFILSLFNYHSIFSLIPSSSGEINNYLLQIHNHFQLDFIYLLTIQIKHQLTNEYLSNLTIQFIVDDRMNSSSDLIRSSSSSPKFCLQNSTFYFYDLNKTNSIGKLKVIETNLNVLLFSTFFISKLNENEIIIDQCRMIFEQLNLTSNLNQSHYQLCSVSNECFNISLVNNSQTTFMLRGILTIRPIEITILTLSFIFILATITLIVIICRLRGFRVCLSIKNYLFYGKKYGLNNAQRLSSNKITQRVHSIVVRESQSPTIEHIKSIEPYIFNLNHFIEQDTIPSINLYSQSSSHISISSLQRKQRTISNVDNEITAQRSSSVVQENKQLLEMISSNQDLDLSRLASEV